MKNGYIEIYNNIFPTLLALSAQEQEQGLMFIDPPVPIMSFVYSYPRVNKFWMKSTPSPLDIIFVKNNQITQICYGEPHSTSVIGNNQFSDLVVEFPSGTIDRFNIKIGHHVELFEPSLLELFSNS